MPICDRTIINETKWYKATDDMVTNETQIGLSCGTTYALWMQGNLFISERTDVPSQLVHLRVLCDNCYGFFLYKSPVFVFLRI